MGQITTEDVKFLISQPPHNIEMILSGMSALLSDIGEKSAVMDSQVWFQRMIKTVTGKPKLPKE